MWRRLACTTAARCTIGAGASTQGSAAWRRLAEVTRGGGAIFDGRCERRRLSAAPAAASPSTEVSPSVSPPSVSSAAPAPALAAKNSVPMVAPGGVDGIVYKGPIAEDDHGGGRHASAVSAMWSNIPHHVRASFESHSSTADAPKSSAPLLMDTVVSKAKALVATTGLAPASWRNAASAAEAYYGGQIALAPYQKGQTAAYHYPRVLVPRKLANRFPLEMYVDPVFQTSDEQQKPRMKSATLFPRLQGKTTLLLVFSGQPLSGLWTGLRRWLNLVEEEFRQLPKTQVFKLHCEEGWFNRRTHQLTKFHLRRQVDDSELFTTFVYRGKWKFEYVHKLHLYNKDLPVVLLLDGLGYIRWHAVGLPTDDAATVFRALAARLAREKRSVI